LALAFAGLLAALIGWAVLARHFAPLSNTHLAQFDAIIVLGTPADSDGNPSPTMLERVTEGVGEYRRGVAAHLIVTGAAAHNKFVEAEVMARVAEAQGVPPSAILKEPDALDTIQNACYSARILKTRGWHSVEVVSSPAHLPRAAMILAHLASANPGQASLEWRVHATSENLAPGDTGSGAAVVETFKTARYLVWARWFETCDP
jgi:uncharacterized SAM-binding protein YcdF (DUF218 family)